MNNIVNQIPYLPTTTNFPKEIDALSGELTRRYVDISGAVNNRTIGLYPNNNPAITGNSWYTDQGQKQQTLRQVYQFTATGSIPHNIKFSNYPSIANAYGSYTNGTNSYGVIYATSVALIGQVTFYITNQNIVILSGAGAPSIQSGIIVIEWLSQI